MIPRPLYLNALRSLRNVPLVKILVGVRRCGKSTILAMLREELIASGIPEERILARTYTSEDIDHALDDRKMYLDIRERMKGRGFCYLLLDEVQEIENWEKAINSLLEEGNADIYVTGSNSRLMASEISTYLSGRYVSIPVYPLSLGEYQNPYGLTGSVGKDYSAADLLLCMTSVAAGSDVNLNGLVKFCGCRLLYQSDRVSGFIRHAAVYLLCGLSVFLTMFHFPFLRWWLTQHFVIFGLPPECCSQFSRQNSLCLSVLYHNAHASCGSRDHAHRSFHARRVQVRHLQLGDLSHLVFGDRRDLRLVRHAGAGLQIAGLLQKNSRRRSLGDEAEASVRINGDDNGDDQVALIRRSGVELLGKFNDVHTMLSERGADRGSRGSLSRRDL